MPQNDTQIEDRSLAEAFLRHVASVFICPLPVLFDVAFDRLKYPEDRKKIADWIWTKEVRIGDAPMSPRMLFAFFASQIDRYAKRTFRADEETQRRKMLLSEFLAEAAREGSFLRRRLERLFWSFGSPGRLPE